MAILIYRNLTENKGVSWKECKTPDSKPQNAVCAHKFESVATDSNPFPQIQIYGQIPIRSHIFETESVAV